MTPEEERRHHLLVMACKNLVDNELLDDLIHMIKQKVFNNIDKADLRIEEVGTYLLSQKAILEGLRALTSMIRKLVPDDIDKT